MTQHFSHVDSQGMDNFLLLYEPLMNILKVIPESGNLIQNLTKPRLDNQLFF